MAVDDCDSLVDGNQASHELWLSTAWATGNREASSFPRGPSSPWTQVLQCSAAEVDCDTPRRELSNTLCQGLCDSSIHAQRPRPLPKGQVRAEAHSKQAARKDILPRWTHAFQSVSLPRERNQASGSSRSSVELLPDDPAIPLLSLPQKNLKQGPGYACTSAHPRSWKPHSQQATGRHNPSAHQWMSE